MNKSQKIYFSTGDTGNQYLDKHITVKLEQDIETLEFMSLKLGTADVYQNFNSSYGVLVGRVLANGGVGIPNAKISIFIPIDDADAQDSEIYSLYPYKTPRDKNNNGKRYNLLPRVSRINPSTQQLEPKQAFGSFPIKEEMLGNPPLLEIYKKYYKYTALTNEVGDYMIFGVPTGTQTVHLSVDITDIGKYSMTPASMVVNLGYSSNLFTNNNTKIKSSSDLTDLPNIETQEITVDVRPFWGDTENFEIGITRQDFRIRSVLNNTFVLFGSVMTDGNGLMWGDAEHADEDIDELFRAKSPMNQTVSIGSKRIGKVTEKIYYYPSNITDSEISSADPTTDMLLLDPSEYSIYKRDGDFVFIISCNRNKVIIDEAGNQIPVNYDNEDGIFTTFSGFITLEITTDDIPMSFSGNIGSSGDLLPLRYKLKFPQYATRNSSFRPPYTSGGDYAATFAWRKQYKTFEGGKFYSISKFQPVVYNDDNNSDGQFPLDDGFFNKDKVNRVENKNTYWNVGVIVTENIGDVLNDIKNYPYNTTTAEADESGTYNAFGANWMNLTVHLPQVGYLIDKYRATNYVRVNDNFAKQLEGESLTYFNSFFLENNTQQIAAGDFDTKWFARSDIHWTDLIEVPLHDILLMKDADKGFTSSSLPTITGETYRNGTNPSPSDWTVTEPCPFDGGRLDGKPANDADPEYYFYKGLNDADCIQYIIDLGLV